MSRLDDNRTALQSWLATVTAAKVVETTTAKPLTGGAIQENWRLECTITGGAFAGEQRFVLRSDAPSGVAASLSRSQEFCILKVAHSVGVTVPKPLWLCEDTNIIGTVFYIMQLVDGIGLGPKIVKDASIGGSRQLLGQTLARELAMIHSVRPPNNDLAHSDLEFLPMPATNPATDAINGLRQHLDAMDEARPVLEWGLRWAELNLPPAPEITLVHNDFRTGNYLLDEHGLTGILDWEFAAWGDPMTDIGWFCAKCWRFSRPDLEAGGITTRQVFYDAYQVVSGRMIDPVVVNFWEVMAHLRWAVIALQQAHRHLSGTQQSLELALIGRLLPDLENQILTMTKPENWNAA